MNISHELTIPLLKKSYKINDYDYCLPHLLDKHEEYLKFFIKSSKSGRFIIMDNGLFEGVAHTTDDLIEKIGLIKPDIFIVPDAWNDIETTYDNAHDWLNVKQYLPENTQLMVVIQGTDINQFCALYEGCENMGYKHFAFNHSSIQYQNEYYHPNPIVNQTLGRVNTISRMKKDNIIKDEHYIHLLGCSSWFEGNFYKYPEFEFINSIDTSSPIINGILNIRYDESNMFEKPMNKIEEFLTNELNPQQHNDIIFNVNKFKNIYK